MITGLSVVMGVLGASFLILKNPIYWILGWGILQLFSILDSSDGQVARYTKSSTKYGSYLDDLVHVTVESLIFIVMTFGLYNAFNDISIFAFGLSSVWCMMMFRIHHLLCRRVLKKPKSSGGLRTCRSSRE